MKRSKMEYHPVFAYGFKKNSKIQYLGPQDNNFLDEYLTCSYSVSHETSSIFLIIEDNWVLH